MSKTDPKRFILYCRKCWARSENDVALKVCLRENGVGNQCQGELIAVESPAWKRLAGKLKPPRRFVPNAERPIEQERAGTTLAKHASVTIWSGPQGSKKRVGLLDMANRVFQSGGEAGNFIYRKEHLVTLPMDVWLRIQLDCDRVELIDHVSNLCYRCRTYVLRRNPGKEYEAGIGHRIGWPLDWWDIEDAHGNMMTPGNPPPMMEGLISGPH